MHELCVADMLVLLNILFCVALALSSTRYIFPLKTSSLLIMPSTQIDELSPSIVLPAKQVDASLASRDEWVSTFALLTISGVDINMCAERLKKPVNVLQQLFATVPFQSLLKSIANETGRDAAVSLLKSTAVDSVMKIIKLRDTAKSEQIQLRAATTLLTWNYFHQKSESLPQGDETVRNALKKSGLDVNDSVDKELQRLIDNSPTLKAHPMLKAFSRERVLPEADGGKAETAFSGQPAKLDGENTGLTA